MIDAWSVPDDDERAIVESSLVRPTSRFRPNVVTYKKSDTYPESLIETMKKLGGYGCLIGEPHRELAVSAACFAAVIEEVARGYIRLDHRCTGLARYPRRHMHRRKWDRHVSGPANGQEPVKVGILLSKGRSLSDMGAVE